jgi:NAD(P)-dependent dehydrogenase (short-subunit alcohol dehydrogenase family)
VNLVSPTGRLAAKVAIVTGGGSGIGNATAKLFAQEGAKVMVADINESAAIGVTKEIEAAGGAALAIAMDVSLESSWDTCVQVVLTRWSRLDVLVNCAGIATTTPVVEMSLEEWRRVHAVNLDGAFLGTRAGIRAMRGCGGGSIVNISSLSGIEAFPGATAYASSKAAVIQFSKVAATECAQAGDRIRINVIAPAGVKTPMWKTTPFWQELAIEGEDAAWRKLDPQNSFYTPEEIAASVLELASDESMDLNGSVRVLNRGAPLSRR